MNSRFKYLMVCLSLSLSSFLLVQPSFGDAICDFNGDGMSEIAFVNVNKQGTYDWSTFDPRTGKLTALINGFGGASSKLIPGNWFQSGRAVAAIVDPVTPGINGRAKWIAKSLDYAGGATVTRSLGRPGDIIIQGGDYDGNGITDSLILKRTTGKLGLRVNYFLSSYNGDNLGKERLYKALGAPFKDPNFFFSPDGQTDYLAVLKTGAGGYHSALQLKPFTDKPTSFGIGTLPGGSKGPLPLKQGPGKEDSLVFYAPRNGRIQLTVKSLQGATIYSKSLTGNGAVSVGDYLNERGWEIAVQSGKSFTIINPRTKSEHTIQGPDGQVVSCITNQIIY